MSVDVRFVQGLSPESIGEATESSRAEGVIVLGTELEREDLLLFANIGRPKVFIDSYYPDLILDFVDIDNTRAAFDIAYAALEKRISAFLALDLRPLGMSRHRPEYTARRPPRAAGWNGQGVGRPRGLRSERPRRALLVPEHARGYHGRAAPALVAPSIRCDLTPPEDR